MATWIPDMFPGACCNHDECYGEEGKSKEECDAEFRNDIFNESGPWPNIVTPLLGWGAVRFGGQESFNKAQSLRKNQWGASGSW
jgi:hypothetical protein